MKLAGDVKPKLEPESPTLSTSAPVPKSKRATKAKAPPVLPKVEPDLEKVADERRSPLGNDGTGMDAAVKEHMLQDVKPDVRELEDLLGGLNLEQ
jgi:hypothetical protein